MTMYLTDKPRTFALDIKSTGVNPARDKIIELAIIEVNDQLQEIGTRTWRFNPGCPIPPGATRVHGITDDDIAAKPFFRQHATRVQRLLERNTVIAYNGTRFDLPLLQRELIDAGQPGITQQASIVDPYRLFQQDSPRTLSDACRYYGGSAPLKAHAAEHDARAMITVLQEQVALRRRNAPTLDLRSLVEPMVQVDSGGWFYRKIGDGPLRFARGKLRHAIAALHPAYLGWMLRQSLPSDTRSVVQTLSVRVAS